MVRFQQPTDWQSKVDKVKGTLSELQTDKTKLAHFLRLARERKEEAEAQVSSLNTEIEAASQLLLDVLEAEDVTQFRLTDGTLISIKDDVYCSVQDKQAFHEWVKANTPDWFTVNYQTMSSAVKDRLIAGESLPPGVVTFFKASIQLRKPKERGEG